MSSIIKERVVRIILGVHIIMYLIGEVVWGTVQWVWDNGYIMSFKTVVPLRD